MEYSPIPDNTIFEIADPFNVSSTGEPFVHYDNGRENRIIIFGTRGSLDFLQNSENWFMDGTFSTVPPQFPQLYTVHGLQQGRNVVGAYPLLTNKRLETYAELLTQIQILTNHVNPHSIMVDFEQAMIGATRNVYPLVPQKGCLFHLSKNIYRKVQDLGLSQLYLDDEQFRTNIRMIAALSFLPIEDTIQAFEVLANNAGNDEQPIMDYFETTYIGELRRGRRLRPLFPHALWNMNMRVQEDLPRTNNDLEGWHTRFSGSFLHHHAHIWKCIDKVKQDSSLYHLKMAQMVAGAQNPPQRRIYREINERIRTLVDGYENNNIDFLRGISYNLPQ